MGINQRQRNQFAFGNVIWDVTRNMHVGFEVSRYATDWSLPRILGTDAFIHHPRGASLF